MGCSGCPSHQEQPQESGPEVLVNIKLTLHEEKEITYKAISFESLHITGRMIQFQDVDGFLRAFLLADDDRAEIVSVEPLPQ
jgi:hypothetical protein